MIATAPYLLRAFYPWIVDNGWTPYLLVDATVDEVVVPRDFVVNGSIVLNVAPKAVRDLELGNDCVRFSARFDGNPHEVSVPIRAVRAIYAKENGRGIMLPEAREGDGDAAGVDDGARHKPPRLTLVR